MLRHVAVPILILCVLSQLVVKCPAQWIDTVGNNKITGFDGIGQPIGMTNPLSMSVGTNGFGYGIRPGPLYRNGLGGHLSEQINYRSGIPLNCIGTMGPGVPGIGYGNGANLGPGYLGPIGQPFGYGSGVESSCISNCLMGARLDYGNGLGAVPAYPSGMSMPGALPVNTNPEYLNAMPNLVGALDPAVGVLGNGLSVNPIPSIPHQATLNANENTNTNTNVNINNNMDKQRHGRFGMLGMPHF